MPARDGGRRTLLSGWGRATATTALLQQPTSPDEVVEALGTAGPRGTVARGLGRSYGDAAQNAGGQVIAMTGLDRVRAFDPTTGVVVAESGCDLNRLFRLTVPAGWWLPAAPGTRFVTLGGAIANDVHGKSHRRDGSIRTAVRALELLTTKGEHLVVTPDGTPALFAATLGGLGLTGIILSVTLQLEAIETAWMRVRTERVADLDGVLDRMTGQDDARYSVAWVDCLAQGRRLGRSVLTRGDHARLQDVPVSSVQEAQPRRYQPRQWLTVPSGIPNGLLGPRVAMAFNRAKFNRAPHLETEELWSLTRFFHPLDAIRGWNRLYGRRGFVQYQFVLPLGAEASLGEIIELLARERCASFLAVLKRLGAGAGMLSFPIAGWTLAIDVPADQPGLGRLLDRVDELVVLAGGRVYLAKDARLHRSMFEAMYPDLAAWQRVRELVDPSGVLCSDMARRLGLGPHEGGADA